MAGINKVILIGNLGKDPETFTFNNGEKKVSFSLATTESYKNKEGARVDRTEWHNIVMYKNLAEIAVKYLKKGQSVYLEGSIRTRSWEDNGQKRYITEIEASQMTMLGSRRSDDEASTGESATEENSASAPVFNPPGDDLPF